MRQWTGLSLVQVMDCRLLGAKPLPEPIQVYYQLASYEQISVKFEPELYNFHSNMHLKMWSAKMAAVLSRSDELRSVWVITSHRKQWIWLLIHVHSSVTSYKQQTGLIKTRGSYQYKHYGGVIMGAIASQIISLTIVYSTVYSDAD